MEQGKKNKTALCTLETKAEERNARLELANSEKEPKIHENQERDAEPCNLAYLSIVMI